MLSFHNWKSNWRYQILYTDTIIYFLFAGAVADQDFVRSAAYSHWLAELKPASLTITKTDQVDAALVPEVSLIGPKKEAKAFVCVCGGVCRDADDLKRHARNECSIRSPFKCPLCVRRYEHQSLLNSHMRRAHSVLI